MGIKQIIYAITEEFQVCICASVYDSNFEICILMIYTHI